MGVMGLGGFGKSFLDAYSTMSNLDAQDRQLILKQKLAEEQAKLRALEEQKLRAELARQQAEEVGYGEIAAGVRDLPAHEIQGAMPGLIARSKNPRAAAAAAKGFTEGAGGAMPWDLRERRRTDEELAGWVSVHRSDPSKVTAQDIADRALRLGKKPEDLKLVIPEQVILADVMKAYYTKLNEVTGGAQGLTTRPDAPTIPGRPTQLGAPGGPTIENPAAAGRIQMAQESGMAGARAGGGVIGKGDALASTSPITGQTYGQGEAAQAGLEAEARQTQLDRAKKQLEIDLLKIDQTLKAAQVEQDLQKRGQLAADALNKLAMARFYVNMVPKEDPTRPMFDQLYASALTLSKEGAQAPPRRALPVPAPVLPPAQAPQAGPGVPGTGGKIRVRNKATGQTGTLSEQFFDPSKYERLP